jgi:DNA-binding response OmpR family regulator
MESLNLPSPRDQVQNSRPEFIPTGDAPAACSRHNIFQEEAGGGFLLSIKQSNLFTHVCIGCFDQPIICLCRLGTWREANVAVMAHSVDLDRLETSYDRSLVMVVDDDPDTVTLLKAAMMHEGMRVVSAFNGLDALAKAAEMRPDLILLDIMMPEMDGWEVFSRMREFTDAPIIIVSAKGTKKEIVNGLESGVDDYLTKPLHLPELAARVRAVLRRAGPLQKAAVYLFPEEDLLIELETRHVSYRGRVVDLAPTEFALLRALAEAAPRPASYEQITQALWGLSDSEERNRIKFLIHSLRQKLETEPDVPSLIVNRLGFGYQLRVSQAG